MPNLNTPKLLRSLTKMIEKPELNALQLSLVKTLREIVVVDAVHLFELRTFKQSESEGAKAYLVQVAHDDAVREGATNPMPLRRQPAFEQCFESRTPVIVSLGDSTNQKAQAIYPILEPVGVTGFLVLENKQHLQRDADITTALLGLYNNFVLLLNDNQHDHLTGLLNRKSFDEKIMKMILSLGDGKRKVDKDQYCLAVLDIDFFKHVNDTHGHLMGDEVLLHFSQCMKATFREYDLLFRVGGEEFVVVLRNVESSMALEIMERFRHGVETHYFPQVGTVTVSIGVTSLTATDLPVTAMDRADKALYFAKEHGRNQVAFFEHLVATGKLGGGSITSAVDLF